MHEQPPIDQAIPEIKPYIPSELRRHVDGMRPRDRLNPEVVRVYGFPPLAATVPHPAELIPDPTLTVEERIAHMQQQGASAKAIKAHFARSGNEEDQKRANSLLARRQPPRST